jgi:C-terminal processing protease CtpA/Prc
LNFKTLKTEGRHVANNVREDLPASKAGQRVGDYIPEVNGEQIHVIEHDHVDYKLKVII